MPNYGDYQNGIYTEGIGGIQPRLPFLYHDLKKCAREILDRRIFGYVAGGAGDGLTQTKNAEAFYTYGIMPRMLRDRTTRDLSAEIFGTKVPSPIYVAPVGVLGAVYPDGDLAVAKAACAHQIPVLCSTLSSAKMEDTRKATRGSLAYFQLYPPNDQELSDNFVSRAVEAEFDGLVVTLDTGTLGWRPHDLQVASIPMHYGQCLANYTSDPAFWRLAGVSSEEELTIEKKVSTWDKHFSDTAFSWDHIKRIRSMVKKPLLLKGICAPEDAKKAVDYGVDAIICSNHGGRQANGGLPALDCLPGILAAIPNSPVWFDSGIRNGIDILKALALGAAIVGIGRPYVYGLALGGQSGVEFVLKSLLAEADLNMAVDCYASISELREYGLTRVQYLSTQADGLA